MSKINKNVGLELLDIYRQYIELINYTEMICEKVPMPSGFSIVNNIKNTTYDGMDKIIKAYKYYQVSDKLSALNELDIDLKMLKVLIRTLKKQNYINSKNIAAWSRKLFNIGNLLGGWIRSCQRQ